MDTQRTYALADLAGDFGLTERTARHYIENVLPPHHKTGRGKVARYGQDTWNCFAFIRLIRDRYGLGPSQASGLLADIVQDTVDRIVNGEEDLAITGVPTLPDDAAAPESADPPRVSARATRFRVRKRRGRSQTQMHGKMSAHAPALGPEPFAPEPVEGNVGEEPFAETSEWQTVYADDKLRVQYKGKLNLTHFQEEQVEAAAWLIRQAVE